MIELNTDKQGIVHLKVRGKIQEGDFENNIQASIDKLINSQNFSGKVLIDARDFQGWTNFDALFEHLNFVKNHHRYIQNLALIGDNPIFNFAPNLLGSLVNPELKHFSAKDEKKAEEWLTNSKSISYKL